MDVEPPGYKMAKHASSSTSSFSLSLNSYFSSSSICSSLLCFFPPLPHTHWPHPFHLFFLLLHLLIFNLFLLLHLFLLLLLLRGPASSERNGGVLWKVTRIGDLCLPDRVNNEMQPRRHSMQTRLHVTAMQKKKRRRKKKKEVEVGEGGTKLRCCNLGSVTGVLCVWPRWMCWGVKLLRPTPGPFVHCVALLNVNR